ncbi:histidine phosphatase family protein [Leadbetterella sp. DM7]|uniref:histidine phosphatase family protein n=1 Tax=Leadbetterella sp. DM7 TaxID=3235085 RepID=UPI00349E88B6
MLTIYLLRHGETDFNAQNNRYCGRTDIPVNAKGRAQAEAVRRQLEGVTFMGVYSSPLLRAYETAQIVSGRKVTKDDRLIEVDFGLWEGKTREQFTKEHPDSWEKWSADPSTNRAGVNGETGQEVVTRVDAFFEELLGTHREGTFLVVAHNGVNRLFMAHKLGMPLANYRRIVQQNSSVTRFTLSHDEGFTLELLNSKL